jgi:hypothetical protein
MENVRDYDNAFHKIIIYKYALNTQKIHFPFLITINNIIFVIIIN